MFARKWLVVPPSATGKSSADKPRIDEFEQRGVFDREHEADPMVAPVGDGQLALHRVEPRVGGEARGGAAQLIRRRLVLGVVDAKQLAARDVERDIERPRLGARLARRHDDDVVARRQPLGADRRQGLLVAALDDELDVEFRLRVVEPVERGHQLGDHRALAIHRHDDGVDRQIGVGERRRRGRDIGGDGRGDAQPDGRRE